MAVSPEYEPELRAALDDSTTSKLPIDMVQIRRALVAIMNAMLAAAVSDATPRIKASAKRRCGRRHTSALECS
jgi:hypothetical protein